MKVKAIVVYDFRDSFSLDFVDKHGNTLVSGKKFPISKFRDGVSINTSFYNILATLKCSAYPHNEYDICYRVEKYLKL